MNKSTAQDFEPIVIGTITSGTRNANPIPQCPDGWALHRVWTVLNEHKLREYGPVHNISAFLEEPMHDYKIVKGNIHYFSRLVDANKEVKVAFEFAPVTSLSPRQQSRNKGL